MTDDRLTLESLNALDQQQFIAAIGGVFEHSPWITAEAWRARPFTNLQQLHAAMWDAIDGAPREQQIALIRAHPDLAGKAAIAGDLTPESRNEQASVGLDRLTPDEFAEFTRLNTAYREQFGFPFVICVREHTKTSILEQFRERLQHDEPREIITALGEISKIGWLRLRDAVADA